MEKFRLDGKVIIVTGASGLLGKNFCLDIAKAGGVVILADINRKEGIKLQQKISKECGKDAARFCNTDITNLGSIKKLIKFTTGKFGRIDGLVNNAYPRNKNYGKKFEDVAYKDFCENVNMHIGGYFLITQQISKTMIKQCLGNIVNIASIYGFAAPRFELYEGTNMTVPVEYSVIKGAVINLTRYLSSYLGRYNIRVNSISPGGVFDSQPRSFVKRYVKKVLLGRRMANVEDLSGALIFLLSDSSVYITGQNIVVDGGWTV